MNTKHYFTSIFVMLLALAGLTSVYGEDLIEEPNLLPEPSLEALTITSSIHIPSDPCVGTWDSLNRIYTLTTNVYDTLVVDEDNMTLDANGHTVIPGTGAHGVYLDGRTGVTVKDAYIQSGYFGIYMLNSNNNSLVGNTSTQNRFYGIQLYNSHNNTLTNNTVSRNPRIGIFLSHSTNNRLTENTVFASAWGIHLFAFSRDNTLTGNITRNNNDGIFLDRYSTGNTLTENNAFSNYTGLHIRLSDDNTITNNSFTGNYWTGAYIRQSDNNIFTCNTVEGNNNGIYLIISSNNNTIHSNEFLNNTAQAYADATSTGNMFSLAAPTGGNYWSNWTTPDVNDDDNDGFIDSPYVFTGDQDDLPLIPWAVTYDGPTLLSTGGLPTVDATLIATLRNTNGDVLDINDAEVLFRLTAEGITTIEVTADSNNGLAQAAVTLEPAIYKIDIYLTACGTSYENPDASAYLVVYNPEGGFATGGGWFVPQDDGYNTHPNIRANFGFNAKYKKGMSTGHIEFRYTDEYIDLKSTSIEQLVITGGKIAMFKGYATVNEQPENWFFAKAVDNGQPGTEDTFQIKIWAPTQDIDADPNEHAEGKLKGGNILVHTKNKK